MRVPLRTLHKMYNGIGLTTTRGTGTSGHIQRNVAAIRQPRRSARNQRPNPHEVLRQQLKEKAGNAALTAHEKRRKVEVSVAELEEELLARGYEREVIDGMTERLRNDLLERDEDEQRGARDRDLEIRDGGRAEVERADDSMRAHRNQKLRGVLGIEDGYKEGDAFKGMKKLEDGEKTSGERREPTREANGSGAAENEKESELAVKPDPKPSNLAEEPKSHASSSSPSVSTSSRSEYQVAEPNSKGESNEERRGGDVLLEESLMPKPAPKQNEPSSRALENHAKRSPPPTFEIDRERERREDNIEAKRGEPPRRSPPRRRTPSPQPRERTPSPKPRERIPSPEPRQRTPSPDPYHYAPRRRRDHSPTPSHDDRDGKQYRGRSPSPIYRDDRDRYRYRDRYSPPWDYREGHRDRSPSPPRERRRRIFDRDVHHRGRNRGRSRSRSQRRIPRDPNVWRRRYDYDSESSYGSSYSRSYSPSPRRTRYRDTRTRREGVRIGSRERRERPDSRERVRKRSPSWEASPRPHRRRRVHRDDKSSSYSSDSRSPPPPRRARYRSQSLPRSPSVSSEERHWSRYRDEGRRRDRHRGRYDAGYASSGDERRDSRGPGSRSFRRGH